MYARFKVWKKRKKMYATFLGIAKGIGINFTWFGSIFYSSYTVDVCEVT